MSSKKRTQNHRRSSLFLKGKRSTLTLRETTSRNAKVFRTNFSLVLLQKTQRVRLYNRTHEDRKCSKGGWSVCLYGYRSHLQSDPFELLSSCLPFVLVCVWGGEKKSACANRLRDKHKIDVLFPSFGEVLDRLFCRYFPILQRLIVRNALGAFAGAEATTTLCAISRTPQARDAMTSSTFSFNVESVLNERSI